MAELENLATTDPLTRLPNRRTAMQQLERELSRTERRRNGGEGLCIGLLDVDNFKRVNDQFGHQAGDDVLRLIGETLNRVMRQGDFVARFGGEEFLIILPETLPAGGEQVADRLRAAIGGIPLDTMPVPHRVTVSIGLAAHDPERRIEETLGLADQALYRAKHLGRDKVVVWAGPAAEAGAAAS
jgi:diguanylate cyclase (GGDEF)-like protein